MPLPTHLEESNEEDDSNGRTKLIYSGPSHHRMRLEFGYQLKQHPEGKKSQQLVPAPGGKPGYGKERRKNDEKAAIHFTRSAGVTPYSRQAFIQRNHPPTAWIGSS